MTVMITTASVESKNYQGNHEPYKTTLFFRLWVDKYKIFYLSIKLAYHTLIVLCLKGTFWKLSIYLNFFLTFLN